MNVEEWQRSEGESSKAYAAFSVYRDLGPTRSIDQAAESFIKASPNLYKNAPSAGRQFRDWSVRFRWPIRAQAFDAHQEAVKREIELTAQRNAAEQFHAQREGLILQMKQDSYEIAQVFRERALAMLNSPLEVPRTDKVGNPIMERNGWTFDTAAKLADTFHKLTTNALDVPQSTTVERIEGSIEHTGDAPVLIKVEHSNDQLIDILRTLLQTGVVNLDQLQPGADQEIIDASPEQIHQDGPDATTNGVPPLT